MSLRSKNIGLPLIFSLIVLTALPGCGSPFMRNILSSKPGSIRHPFEVKDAEDLRHVGRPEPGTKYAEWGLGKHYRQVAPIDLNGTIDWHDVTNEWVPIGTLSEQFTGSYNGQGNTIIELEITSLVGFYRGLFAYIGKKGHVLNVKLENITINGISNIGGIAGQNEGIVENCSSTGTINGTGLGNYIGGIAGYNNGEIKSSNSACTVNSSGSYVGGVAGLNTGFGKITNCFSSGSVIGNIGVGGVVGYNTGNDSLVNNCHATGTVEGAINTGGVVGENESAVEYCYFTGTVQCDSNTGGVIGHNNGNVKCCYAKGTIQQNSGAANFGGIIGNNGGSGSVSNCYTMVDIVAVASNNAGGIVGENNFGGKIEFCYATGSISCNENGGGIAGFNFGTIVNCVALNEKIFVSLISEGRIAANIASGSVLDKNYGWELMDPPGWVTLDTGKDGYDVNDNICSTGWVGYTAIYFWETLVGFTFMDDTWKWTDGYLPHLFSGDQFMPSYLP